MFNAINFVNRAVVKKTADVDCGNFLVKNNTIYASNGVFTMAAPFALPIDCQPKGNTFFAIMRSANDAKIAPSFTMTPTGKLSIKAGKLKALIECSTNATPDYRPEGIDHSIDGEAFMTALAVLEPFMGDNPNPALQWANGLLLGTDAIRVTCNTVAIRYDLSLGLTQFIMLPSAAVKELLRIKREPIGIRYCAKSITFFYGDGYWFKTRTMENKMPNFENIIDAPCDLQVPPNDFFDGLKQLKPFCDEHFMSIRFTDEGLITANGADYAMELPVNYGLYNYNILSLLEKVVDKIDFSLYPKPVIFTGSNLKGCLVGLR